MKRTRNPIIWLQYLCWWIQFLMACHEPRYPLRMRVWLSKSFPSEQFIASYMARSWEKMGFDYRAKGLRVWSWWLGDYYLGPFETPWRRLRSCFRSMTGGRSHRCEFTDPEHGALYGHQEGAFMDRMFENFVGQISDDGDNDTNRPNSTNST